MVTARQFLLPVLARLQGQPVGDAVEWRKLPLTAQLGSTGNRETFVRGHWGVAGLVPLGNQDSGAQGALAVAEWLSAVRRAGCAGAWRDRQRPVFLIRGVLIRSSAAASAAGALTFTNGSGVSPHSTSAIPIAFAKRHRDCPPVAIHCSSGSGALRHGCAIGRPSGEAVQR